MNILTPYTGIEMLDVEGHDLFGDLEHHVEPILFEEWERFKEKAAEFYEARESILSKIDARVEEVTGLNVSDRWEDDIVYDRRLSMRILEVALCLGEGADETFESKYLNFDSKVDIDGGYFVYSINGQAYIKVSKEEKKEEEFRERFDGKITELVEEAKRWVEAPEIAVLLRLKQELENLMYWIRSRLIKNLRKPVLGGDCEYIR